MKITRKNLQVIINSIIREQFKTPTFTIPTRSKHSGYEYYTGGKSQSITEIEASEVGDDSRADMGGEEPGEGDLWDEDDGFLNELEKDKKKERNLK